MLYSLDMPDHEANLSGWLEGHLVDHTLPQLVSELEAVRETTAEPRSLDQILGSQRGEILRDGLGAVAAERLRQLLQNPQALMELQQAIASEGGSYWDQVTPARPLAATEQQQRFAKVASLIAAYDELNDQTPAVLPARAWYKSPVVLTACAAAALLLAVVIFQGVGRGGGVAWGLDQPLPNADSEPAYVLALADRVAEFQKKKPNTPAAVRQRISEFRAGCLRMVNSKHPTLSPANELWLQRTCRTWSGRMDAHLQDLAQGRDAATVRQEAQQSVNELIDLLHGKAREIELAA